MMKGTVARTLAVVMLLVALGSAPAQGHERTEPTRITIKASQKAVDSGEKVRFRGKLKSDWSKCFSWQKVSLFKGNKKVATKKTQKSGSYQFTVKPKATKTWKVKYKGRNWGTHPHTHVCLGSSSKGIKVRVR
jgi:hypothetical protein